MADHRETSPRLDAFNTGEFDSLERIYTADCVVHDSKAPSRRTARSRRPARPSQHPPRRFSEPDDRRPVRTRRRRRQPPDVDSATDRRSPDAARHRAHRHHHRILIDRYQHAQIAEVWSNWDTFACCNNSARSQPANPPLPRPPTLREDARAGRATPAAHHPAALDRPSRREQRHPRAEGHSPNRRKSAAHGHALMPSDAAQARPTSRHRR
jgi:hypothetical protein